MVFDYHHYNEETKLCHTLSLIITQLDYFTLQTKKIYFNCGEIDSLVRYNKNGYLSHQITNEKHDKKQRVKRVIYKFDFVE